MNDNEKNTHINIEAGDICFIVNDNEIIKVKENGDIFVKGNLISNNMEVVEGFKDLFKLTHHSYINSSDNPWYNTAAEMSRNADYYRGLVVQIGKMLGEEAYISDDGSVQDDVLCAKVPELVASGLGLKLEE